MKAFLKIIALVAVAVSISTVQAAETQKIGVVFPSKILSQSPQRARMIKKLEAEFKDRYIELQQLGQSIKDIEAKIKRDSELLSTEERTALQRQHQVKVSEYKLKGKAFEEDQRRRQGEEQQKTLSLVRDVINALAKEGAYDLILNGEQVVFAKPELDISDKVIQEISTK